MMPLEFASPILHHCWSYDDIASARIILESMCINGLLRTTNSEKLDGFSINRGHGIVTMEVVQCPRVSFTDIPIDRMAFAAIQFGAFMDDFKRLLQRLVRIAGQGTLR
jgi:hypothetical protein